MRGKVEDVPWVLFDWEHNRLGCTVLEQAKEIDDALTKGGDKESSSAQPGKAKYVG